MKIPYSIKLTIFFLLLFFPTLKASECYNYHTSVTHKIIVKNNSLYYQLTEKDPNGFTYVRQENKLLTGIDKNTYKAIGEDEDGLMFSDKNGFYILEKGDQYEKNTASYSKILGASKNQKHINGRLFLINGKWTYFDGWQNKITKIILNELPKNLNNIKSYSNGFYLKSDKNVLMVSIDFNADKKYEVSVIPNLNPLKTVLYACKEINNEDFLADEQYIFEIRREGDFMDITPQFRALKIQGKLNSLQLFDADISMWRNGQRIIKKREGHSTNGRDPLTGEEINIEYSYSTSKPLIPEFGEINYVFFGNKIYPVWDDNFSSPYVVKTDASKLQSMEGKLLRGNDFYYFEDDGSKLINTNISAEAKFFHGVYSYRNYLPKALIHEKHIYFFYDRYTRQLEDKRVLTSKIVKQLGIFYLFNNALFDGKNTFPITADYESLIYLGSFTDVINGCAGSMENSPQIEINYHHFFKDENSVYYFDEQNNKFQVIQTASTTDYKADDYEALQELYKIKDVKGTIKKKQKSAFNYYAIGGCILVFLGLVSYFLKKKK